MANRKTNYLHMADAYIRDLNKNSGDIGVAVADVQAAEQALAFANQRLDALREDRKFQIIELKGVREILRKLDDADTATARNIEDRVIE